MANGHKRMLQHNRLSERRIGSGRMPVYICGGLLAIIALAYFDGGEEPIRPISQTIELPASGGGE